MGTPHQLTAYPERFERPFSLKGSPESRVVDLGKHVRPGYLAPASSLRAAGQLATQLQNLISQFKV